MLDLLIVGAQKSFTTSLKMYLGEHPSIITHPQQEMAFFTDNTEYSHGYERALAHYYRGVEQADSKKVIAKNAILYLSEVAIKRLHDYNPNCKILLSLRNPADRAYSTYLMESNYADMGFPFERIMDIATKADPDYWPFQLMIDAGNYAKHLKTIYKYFPRDQVMVVLCDEIKEDPVKVCSQIFRWLGVDDKFIPEIKVYNRTMKGGPKLYSKFAITVLKKSPWIRKAANWFIPSYYNHKVGDFMRNLNTTNQKHEAMGGNVREQLMKYYSDSNKELEQLTGKKVTEIWNK